MGEDFSLIANRLSSVKQVTDTGTGEVRYFGSLGGLKVTIYTSSIYIVGSLSKYYNGSNIFTLNRRDTERAVQKLSDELGADVSTAKVTYLEFGDAFVMQSPVEEYLKRLGHYPRLYRNSQPDTLYYRHRGIVQPKTICFYDKTKELRKKKETLPDGLNGQNILRYELRFKNRLSRQIGWQDSITASTLYDRQFYKKMVSIYREVYFAISKRKMLKPTALQEVKNPKDAMQCLIGVLLCQSNKDTIADFMGQLTTAKTLDRVQLYRLGQMIERATEKGKHLEGDTLISELDNQIENACVYL